LFLYDLPSEVVNATYEWIWAKVTEGDLRSMAELAVTDPLLHPADQRLPVVQGHGAGPFHSQRIAPVAQRTRTLQEMQPPMFIRTPASTVRFTAIALTAVLSLSLWSHAADSVSPGSLQPGDLVGICGDSITEQRLYSVFISDYLLMCQPQPKLSTVQFGQPGEPATGFLGRMKSEALVFKPTVATVCYGMNDGGYVATKPNYVKGYRGSMTTILDNLKASGVHFIVLGTPGAVDTFYFKGLKGKGIVSTPEVYNQTLADFGQAAKEVAGQEGVGFADIHALMIDVMAKAKAQNGPDFCVAGPDGIHPYPDGHLIMAYAFLKALGCDGNIGTITIDLKADRAEATEGTKVLSTKDGTVELESTRYPFCFAEGDIKDAKSARSILPFLPFNADLNRYQLVVKNASSKSLKVTWGTQSKIFSAEDLTKGINLAAEFLDNPFNTAFLAVQAKISDQEAFENVATRTLLRSIPVWNDSVPEAKDIVAQLPAKVLAKWQTFREASAAAVVPVKHEIKIEEVK
jgi:lysophospholipase L1-like esterase